MFEKNQYAMAFPGQGSQIIGMGKDIAEQYEVAAEVFSMVDEILSQNLSKLMFNGDIEELTQTQNTQPALMAVSLAIISVIKKYKPELIQNSSYAIGHSLGEYSALSAAEAITIEDCAKLLKIRGEAMQKSAQAGVSGMAAVMGMEIVEIENIINKVKNNDILQIANDNSNVQVVISGNIKAIDRFIEAAVGKKVVKLAVGGAFHSAYMNEAAEIMQQALSNTNIQKPIMPIIANVTADLVTEPSQIKALLVKQVAGRVRFRESIVKLKELGINKIYEIGSGKVLAGLIKRIDREIETVNISNSKELENWLNLNS